MAIKVIKHGETKFKIVCPICGCEFEYEFEDLVERYSIVKQVKCPDCGEWLTHKEVYPTYPHYPNWPKIGDPIPCSPSDPITKPYITWTTTTPGTWPDCETCPNKPDPTKTIVGDTPCTWCKKNQPYCFTGDKFPADYKGGSYVTTPESYKDTITTFSNLKTDNTDWSNIKTIYTTNNKFEK